MSPARSPIKPVTPSSVKILMVVEAAIVAFLAYWIFSEYMFNAYFHDYVDQLLGTHGTTFTAAIGLGIGLAGSAVAATFYRNLQHAKSRLETIATPKIRGAVEMILASLPTVEESPRASVPRVTVPSAITLSSSSPEAAPVPAISENEQKKPSDTKS